MAGDDLHFGLGLAKHGSCSHGHVFVRRAVETVLPDTIILIEFVGQSVHVGIARHSLVECSVEDSHHGGTGHDFLTCSDSHHVWRVVQRCKLEAVLYGLLNILIDYCRRGEVFAAVNNPVTYSVDFGHARDYT